MQNRPQKSALGNIRASAINPQELPNSSAPRPGCEASPRPQRSAHHDEPTESNKVSHEDLSITGRTANPHTNDIGLHSAVENIQWQRKSP